MNGRRRSGAIARQRTGGSRLKGIIFVYGLAVYVLFLAVSLYAVGFIAGLGVPFGIDTPSALGTAAAVLVDLALLGLFGLQHSVMARGWFKRRWTRIVPPAAERSTYVLLSSLVLALLMWQWQGLPQPVWEVSATAGRTLLWLTYAIGWLIVLGSTFMISHTDLFGLRQAWHSLRDSTPAPVPFRARLLYRLVRHPLMLGFVIVFWATPRMTAGHLLFAAAATVYILVALQLEERDLVRHLGERYLEYRRRVPMLLPLRLRRRRGWIGIHDRDQ